MKQILVLILLIITNIGYSQTNTENIAIVYDSLNPNGKVILKNDLILDVDSLSIFLLEETQEKLLGQIDPLTIGKALIGKWTLKSIKRVNGIEINIESYQNIEFAKDGKFILVNPNDTVLGDWNLINEKNGNLQIKYNKPQMQIKDKEILKLLPQEQIKLLTYSSEIKAIKEIDSKTLVFMTFIPQNTQDIDNMFYRLVLTTYTKND